MWMARPAVEIATAICSSLRGARGCWQHVGIATGVLSGLFGVGGGFVIVPALVLFSSMAIHRAVGTSLLVITLVSISGDRIASLRGSVDLD